MKGRKGKELLSFEDTDEDPLPVKRPRLPPNPSASPLSLPDFQKSAEERQLREGLKHEFEAQQEAIKDERLHLSFMYWDGSPNRHMLVVPKRTSISEFLAQARDLLVQDYPSLKKVPSDHLIFVKGDTILPHFLTFYELQLGSPGLLSLHTVAPGEDRDDGPVAKLLERKWYEKNRHIYPASQWVLFDPALISS